MSHQYMTTPVLVACTLAVAVAVAVALAGFGAAVPAVRKWCAARPERHSSRRGAI